MSGYYLFDNLWWGVGGGLLGLLLAFVFVRPTLKPPEVRVASDAVAERLAGLDSLKKRGLVSNAEYIVKRKEIENGPALMMRRLIAVAAAMLASGSACAHGGGLNSEGCHNNRKSGDYHCHRAPAVARAAPPSVPASASGVKQSAQAANASAAPICHVGPRGGTYTITQSGRKNYKGC